MNLDCRLPRERSLAQLLRAIDEDPVHSHYTPCDISGALARHLITQFITGNGIAMLELTQEGLEYLKEKRK